MKAASFLLLATTFAILLAVPQLGDAQEARFKRAVAPSTPGSVTMVYDSKTGNVVLKAGDGIKITRWELKSARGLLIPENAAKDAKDGLFDVVSTSKAFKLNPEGFTELNYGPILPKGLDFERLRFDTTVQASLTSGEETTPLLFVSPLKRPTNDDGKESEKVRETVSQRENRGGKDNRQTEKLSSDFRNERQPNAGRLVLEEGPIQTLREPLRMLLKLKWDGDHLAIDRDHWNEADVEIPEERRRVPDGFPDLLRRDRSKAATLFANLKNIAGARSGGGGGGGDRFQGRGYGETVEMTIDRGPTHFRFKITERTGPERTLEVRCDHSKAMQITLMSPVTLHFRQTEKGIVSIVEAFDDQIHRYQAESFAAICRNHPDFMRERFLQTLDQVGIIVPAIDPAADEAR